MKNKLAFGIAILLLLFCGIKWALGLPAVMDITFGDEAQYLRYGTDLFHTIHKDWGPSYNIWYKLLSLFQHNNIRLFYFNYQVTAVLCALLLFIFLRNYDIHVIIAFWLSFCFMFSTTVMDTWPRVSHFAFILLVFGFIITRNCKTLLSKSVWLTAIFFIAAYARPELFPSFLLMCLLTVFIYLKYRESLKSALPAFVFLIAVVIAFFGIYQLPADSYKGINRTYIAFCQHYAINYVLETKANFNPISEWIDFAHRTFGDCRNFSCILKTHPDLVWHNTLLNIQKYLIVLFEFITSLLFPLKIMAKKGLLLFIWMGILGMVGYLGINSVSRNKFIKSLKENAFILVVMLLFGLPSMATSLLIFPRAHYLLMHALLLIYLIALLLNSIPLFSKIKPLYFFLICLPFIYKSPQAKKYSYYQMGNDSKQKCNSKLVTYLTENNNKQQHTVFSNHLSLSMMLPQNYNDFNTEYEFKPGMHFSDIVKDKKIDYVLVRDILLQDKLLKQDSSWNAFIAQPEAFGFQKQIYCDSCESYLLVKP